MMTFEQKLKGVGNKPCVYLRGRTFQLGGTCAKPVRQEHAYSVQGHTLGHKLSLNKLKGFKSRKVCSWTAIELN